LITFKHKFNDVTSFENTSLIETGSNNTFLQNDAGLAVSMNEKLALKLGYQVRHNSDVSPGKENTDQLITTNLVYKF
jgi:putative salt-induced outer membrane protein